MFDEVSEVAVARRVPFTSDTARLESVIAQGGFVDVFHPVEPGPWPIVVFLHGASDPSFGSEVPAAPHTTGGCPDGCEAFYDAHLTYLAARGAVVYAFNYDFRVPSEFRNQVDDLACIGPTVAATAADYGADPTRTVVLGHSRGATVGAALVFNSFAGTPAETCIASTSELPTAVGFVGLSGDYKILAFTDPQDPTRIVIPSAGFDSFAAGDEVLNTGVPAAEAFQAVSAYAHLDSAADVAFELWWGTEDDGGAREFTEEFATALDQHGHQVTVSVFEGLHWQSILVPSAPGEAAVPTPANLANLNVVLTMAHG
jgi:acetyl esterase/lipase